jgi:hypothetical protein
MINTLIKWSIYMAKIVTESIVITFSKIVKDNDEGTSITSPDIQAALEQVAQELIGDSVVVEVIEVVKA